MKSRALRTSWRAPVLPVWQDLSITDRNCEVKVLLIFRVLTAWNTSIFSVETMGKAYRFVDFPQNRPIGIDVQPRLHELEDLEGTSKSGQSVQAGVTLASIRHVSLPSCGPCHAARLLSIVITDWPKPPKSHCPASLQARCQPGCIQGSGLCGSRQGLDICSVPAALCCNCVVFQAANFLTVCHGCGIIFQGLD